MEIKMKIKMMTKQEVADLYEVSTKALTTQLKPFLADIGKKSGWHYNVNQVKTIIEKLGIPPSYQD